MSSLCCFFHPVVAEFDFLVFPISSAIYDNQWMHSHSTVHLAEFLNVIFHLQDRTCPPLLPVVTEYLLPFTACHNPSVTVRSILI